MFGKIALLSGWRTGFPIHRQISRPGQFGGETGGGQGSIGGFDPFGLALKPEIIHVVAFCEADHAATPDEIIESCGIVQEF